MTETTVAVIQESAIRHNLERLRKAAPRCRVMAVIKANAYGHGLQRIAKLLADVDALAVARVSEGVELRSMGVGQCIVVLGGCSQLNEARLALEHQLDLVVHEHSQFELLEQLPGEGMLNVWLKIDTGMGRLGFRPSELRAVSARLAATAIVAETTGVMTHLASADDPDDPLTPEQLRRFGQAIGTWDGDISVANSAGILVWPQCLEASVSLAYSGSNWIRPGLALFGASPVKGRSARELGLEPAMSFESRLIAVKTIKRGMTVGYGGDWRAPRDTVVGVVAAGYGDGYPRHLGSGTPVLVNDRRVSLIGRVSMDMLNVDLTDVPVAAVGDRVVLWGQHLPIEEIAARAGTISYELMCGLSERVVRRYTSAEASKARKASPADLS